MDRERVAGDSKTRTAFLVVMGLCAQFLVLTAIAMATYSGEGGYSFLGDYFSELGQTRTGPAVPNTASFLLFSAALALAGAGLILFFLVFPRCFRTTAASRWLARAGTAVGVISGIGFVGVAFTPMDLALEAHEAFFLWAFRTFPLAVLLYTAAILFEKTYAKRYAALFGSFAVLLVLYLVLLVAGPDEHTPAGKRVQATGQKLIGYAAIASVFVQAWGARRTLRARENPGP
jgi:hypothetical protein